MNGIGSSQRAILHWLQEKGAATAEEVGDALYESTSACSGYIHCRESAKVRRAWAQRVLKSLEGKQLVYKDSKRKWSAR